MNHAALITRFREHLIERFKHSEVLVTYKESDSLKTTLFKPDKKGMPTLMVFFHLLRCAKNLPITGAVYSYRYQNRDIANLAAPTAFEIDVLDWKNWTAES